ncbi:MAG: flavodoxin [Chloroflexi bacterium]|jgi:menaquinone-dependent protoporphyrinogen oxidase|nr:flavodoxin [Chloroflexota bacterium]
MRVLVAYASRHGATAGIAERIAATLRASGIEAVARPVAEIRDVAGYDAFVIGSAAYMFHWLKEATAFAKRHRAGLAGRPVWLFSSGPLGTDLVDEKGRDIFESSRPKELEELAAVLQPRGDRVFFGAWDPEAPAIGMAERLMRLAPASRSALPAGDFRDWAAIDAWATEIAHELRPATPADA